MADPAPTPEPLTQAEPVAILDLVKGAIAILGLVGVTVPDDVTVKVGAAIVALVFFIQTTLATRKRVTPVARAEAAVEAAKEEGKAEAVEALVAAPPPPAPPASTITLKPPVGLAAADRIQVLADRVDAATRADVTAPVDPETTDEILTRQFGPVG